MQNNNPCGENLFRGPIRTISDVSDCPNRLLDTSLKVSFIFSILIWFFWSAYFVAYASNLTESKNYEFVYPMYLGIIFLFLIPAIVLDALAAYPPVEESILLRQQLSYYGMVISALSMFFVFYYTYVDDKKGNRHKEWLHHLMMLILLLVSVTSFIFHVVAAVEGDPN